MVRDYIKKKKDEGVRDLRTLRNLTVAFSKEYCGKLFLNLILARPDYFKKPKPMTHPFCLGF